MGSIFSVPALHTRTYRSYNSPSMDMHSLATLVCQICVNYRWNMEITWQNVLFWMGSIKRLDLQTTYRYRAKHFRIYFYWRGLPYFVVPRSANMRVSHSGTSNVKILEIFKQVSDLHRSPVSREQIGWWAPYFLCLLYISVPAHPIIRKAWTSIAKPHWSVKFGWIIGEIWKLQGKMSYSEWGPSNG